MIIRHAPSRKRSDDGAEKTKSPPDAGSERQCCALEVHPEDALKRVHKPESEIELGHGTGEPCSIAWPSPPAAHTADEELPHIPARVPSGPRAPTKALDQL